MIRNKSMLIEIWEGDWGLPSIDFDCLRFMTYAKFAGLEVDSKKTNNPFLTPNGCLPVCYIGKLAITSFEDLTSYAKAKNICPDFALSSKQSAEIVAYTNMMKEKLFPALQFIWWIDSKNYTKLTRPWYCKALPFPLSYYYPNKYFKQATEIMETLYEDPNSEKELESRVYGAAEKCLTALSIRLGDSDYMFGSHPSSIDATIYGYLAPLLKAPFSSATLQNHLKACTNLQKYVIRISQRYYPKDYQDYDKRRREELEKNAENSSDNDFPNKTRNQILAGLFAVGAMSFYALSTGIIQHSFEKETDLLDETHLYKHPETTEEEK